MLSATWGTLERRVVDWDEVQMESEALTYTLVLEFELYVGKVIGKF